MNETLKEKFYILFNSLNSEENIPFLNSIIYNEEFNTVNNSLIYTYNNKIFECNKILKELQSLSEKENVVTQDDFKVIVKSTPKPRMEMEFQKKVTEFYDCYDKFQKVKFTYTNKNIFLKDFVQKGFDNCIQNNCEKLIQTSENLAKNCIRDCFKFNQYNSYIMANMINDELQKFKNEVEKF